MLITSRETRRWVIPKGWPMEGRTAAGAAAREAFEEAGLSGPIEDRPLGDYGYLKQRVKGGAIPCRVQVFALEVTQEADTWPEQGQRDRRWFAPQEAAALVDEPELSDLIGRFAAARER